MGCKYEKTFYHLTFMLVLCGYPCASVTMNFTRSAITSFTCHHECSSFNISGTTAYTNCENSEDQSCKSHSICFYNSTSGCDWNFWGRESGTCPNVTASRTKIRYELLDSGIDICSEINTDTICYNRMSCTEANISKIDTCLDCKDCNDSSCNEIVRQSSCLVQISVVVNNTFKRIELNVKQINSTQVRNNYTGCSVNGNWSIWSEWLCGDCTGQCNNGTLKCTRTRTCDKPKPEYGGKNCSGKSTESEYRACKLKPCPVNGNWSTWSEWLCGDCTGKCNSGNQTCTRIRTCDKPKPEYGGLNCSGNSAESEYRACKLKPCPENGNWSTWSEWLCGDCTGQCNNGTQTCTRTRTCDKPKPEYGGKNCSGESTESEYRDCKLKPCPVNGNWSIWSEWLCGDCTGQCNNGTLKCTRARTCDKPEPEYGGKNCSGKSTESEYRDCKLKPCPVNGNWSIWSEWLCGDCTGQCNNGTLKCTRTRTCDKPEPEYDGKNCSGKSTEIRNRACKLKPCPVNGNWSAWSGWKCGTCNGQCNNGTQTCSKTRACDTPKPQYGGKTCSGQNAESEDRVCKPKHCTEYVQWGKWSEWTACTNCSGVCGNGTVTCARTRQCIYLGITNGSNNCEEGNVQLNEFPCQLKPCLAPAPEPLSAAIGSVIGAVGGIIFAVIVIIFLICISRRIKSGSNRNQNDIGMNDLRNTKDGKVTHEGFGNCRSIHVSGTLNENIDNNTIERNSSIYELAKEHGSTSMNKAEENYFTLEKDHVITDTFLNGSVHDATTTEQELNARGNPGDEYFELEKCPENVTTNRGSYIVDNDYTTGNEIMTASNGHTNHNYAVLETDLKFVDNAEKPEDKVDNPDNSNYFILEKQ